jgi:hypothetical protein
MTIDAFDPLTPRSKIRNPASPSIRWESESEAAHESAAALYLEGLFLGCVLVAVASVLPLVMFLRG